MPRRLPSSALDSQTQLTASGTGAVLAGTWYIGTGGAGSGGAVAGTLNGPLTGTADSAKVLTPGKALNGTTFTGADAITVPLNTTSIGTSGTYYPTFVPSNTAGNQQASTHASLSYDPNTGYLNATRFVGSGAGLSGVVTSVSFNGAAAVNGAVSITSPAQVQPDWNATTGLGSILNKPALFSGSYSDLTSKPTLFSGSYADLTNKPTIPAPAPVDSVNGSTGAVKVGSLYDSVGSVAPGSKYVSTNNIIHNPNVFGQLAGSYVGDYFGSTGFSFTGMSVAGFQSAAIIDENGTIINWSVSFTLEFFQAFFDTYAPGYGPDDMRMVNVTMNPQGANYFLQYGVYWNGQPSTARWTSPQNSVNTVSFITNPNLGQIVYRASFSFATDTGIAGQVVAVNGRYSPASWPAYLYLRFWVSK
jgi:hypothetical protein